MWHGSYALRHPPEVTRQKHGVNLAMFLNDPKTNLVWGATAGFLAGFGWVAMGIGIVSLFERRPWSYVLVNGGYLTVALVVMGAILGGWR